MKYSRDWERRKVSGAAARPKRKYRRGSILILAVTMLVITALVGMAYLQQVKMDRFATVQYEREYVNLVINSILADIRTHLAEDVFENLDDQRALWDYPWTDTTEIWQVRNGDGFLVDARGHVKDDRYLASTAPIVTGSGTDPADARWLHLSNLGGIWLELPAIASLNSMPRESLINFTVPQQSDTNIEGSLLATEPAGYERLGVDADGDLVLDSRWTWAPVSVRNLGGRQYVMALRIVDLNSMINVNTATANTSNGVESTGSSRGWTPVDVDLTRLLDMASIGLGLNPSDWKEELGYVFDHRQINSTWAFPFTSPRRHNIWRNQASLHGNTDMGYLMRSEMELRFRAGLQREDHNAPIEDGTLPKPFDGMPKLLRNFPPIAEGHWINVVPRMHEWFHGGMDSDPVEDRIFPAIRHMLTTASGAAVYRPNYGPTLSAPDLKYDLRHSSLSFYQIRDRIQAAFEHPSAAPIAHYLVSELGLSATDLETLQTEYALAIKDYCDTDNMPSHGPNGIYFGLERLPFLREIYVQQLYEDKDLLDEDDPDPPLVVYYDTWVKKDRTQAFAIELGNPFAHELSNSDLDRVRIVIRQGGTTLNIDLTGSGPIEARNDGPNEHGDLLIVYSNTSDTTRDKDGKGTDLLGDLGISGAQLKMLSDDAFWFNGEGSDDIKVKLQVDVGTTGLRDWVTYDQLDMSPNLPNQIPNPPPPLMPRAAAETEKHGQQSFYRDSRKILYVAEDGTGGSRRTPETEASYQTDVDQMTVTNDDKNPRSDTIVIDDQFQIPHNDGHALLNDNKRNVFSVAELGRILMFGFTRSDTFPKRLANMDPLRWFLDIRTDPSAPVPGGNMPSGVPHAAMLFDQFTTVGPHIDQRDNDNDDGDNDPSTSIDNDEEQLVPGTINVNTAPLHILTLAAPLPEPIDNIEALMRTIVAYRDWPIRFPDDRDFDPSILDARTVRDNIRISSERRLTPGIASLGELLFLNPERNGSKPADSPFNMQWYGFDNKDQSNSMVDIYPDPDETSSSAVSAQGSPEEQLARFQFLSQAYTVRSDRFVVYGVVRGYPARQFNAGPVEEAQFIAVLDRGNLVDSDDVPRVIGFMRLR